MTELMKRYEAETGKKAIIALSDTGKNVYRPSYTQWLEAQLTWRPVSEKPTLREMGHLLCKRNVIFNGKVITRLYPALWGIALEDWEDFVARLEVVAWLTIPPQGEK